MGSKEAPIELSDGDDDIVVQKEGLVELTRQPRDFGKKRVRTGSLAKVKSSPQQSNGLTSRRPGSPNDPLQHMLGTRSHGGTNGVHKPTRTSPSSSAPRVKTSQTASKTVPKAHLSSLKSPSKSDRADTTSASKEGSQRKAPNPSRPSLTPSSTQKSTPGRVHAQPGATNTANAASRSSSPRLHNGEPARTPVNSQDAGRSKDEAHFGPDSKTAISSARKGVPERSSMLFPDGIHPSIETPDHAVTGAEVDSRSGANSRTSVALLSGQEGVKHRPDRETGPQTESRKRKDQSPRHTADTGKRRRVEPSRTEAADDVVKAKEDGGKSAVNVPSPNIASSTYQSTSGNLASWGRKILGFAGGSKLRDSVAADKDHSTNGGANRSQEEIPNGLPDGCATTDDAQSTAKDGPVNGDTNSAPRVTSEAMAEGASNLKVGTATTQDSIDRDLVNHVTTPAPEDGQDGTTLISDIDFVPPGAIESPQKPAKPLQVQTPVSSRSTSIRPVRMEEPAAFDGRSATTIESSVRDASDVGNSLTQFIREFEADQNYFVKTYLSKARSFGDDSQREKVTHPVLSTMKRSCPNGLAGVKRQSPFARMIAQCTETTDEAERIHPLITVEGPETSGRKVKSLSNQGSAVSTWEKPTHVVPAYTHCTALKQSVAAPNDKVLHFLPYLGEDVNAGVWDVFENRYHVDTHARQRKIRQGQQVERMLPYVQQFLAVIGISEQTVLCYLLQPATPEVDESERSKSCKEDFDRTIDRWVKVYSRVEQIKPSPRDLQIAGWACTAFLKRTGYSLWHIVRKHEVASLDDSPSSSPTSTIDEIQKIACRVCHQHDCPNHMDYMEHSDSEEENDVDSEDSVEAKDLDWPLPCNHERRFAIPEPLSERPDSRDNIVVGGLSRDKQAYLRILQAAKEKGNDKRKRFYPCYHPGLSCSDSKANCKCFKEGLLCEKACKCSNICERRFRGCTCHARGRKFCYQDGNCECHSLHRECDADLCKSCGAERVLDPVNRGDETLQAQSCRNVHVQLGTPKRTILGKSGIHGFGVYAGEMIRKHDFVGEYKGEITLDGERNRRGDVYELLRLSYLFMLTKDQEIDSHYAGNKVRFINHAKESGKNGACNVQPSIVMCNMTPRIAMYALRDIQNGEELFFNYGEHYMQLLHGSKDDAEATTLNKQGRKKRKYTRRKKADLTGFAEPEYEEVQTPEGKTKSKMVTPRYNVAKKREAKGEASKPGKRTSTASKSVNGGVRRVSTDAGSILPAPDLELRPKGEVAEVSDSDAALGPQARKRRAMEEESDFEPDTDYEATPRKGNRQRKKRRYDDDGDEDADVEMGESDLEVSKVRKGKQPSASASPVKKKRGPGRPRKHAR